MKILYLIKSFAIKVGIERAMSEKMNRLVANGCQLLDSHSVYSTFWKAARQSVMRYNNDIIMQKWVLLFKSYM